MRDPPNLAGAEPQDQRLWNSYVYWARSGLDQPPPDLIIADPANRISADEAALLHAILFTAFALEYRLRSVYEFLELRVRSRDGMWNLLANLTNRTAGMDGHTGASIRFPDEWQSVCARLQNLLELRNRIAHGQRDPVATLLDQQDPSLRDRAVDGFNAVIDAIRIINVAIGYDGREGDELTSYYARLQVTPDGA